MNVAAGNDVVLNINKVKTVEPDSSPLTQAFGIIRKEFPLITGQVRLPSQGLVVISGISGSGKTSLLRATSLHFFGNENNILKVNIEQFNQDLLLKDYFTDIPWLARIGLGDIVTLLTPVKFLSDGQKYRLGLSMALKTSQEVLLIDEFCNQLDEISTVGILNLVKKLATDKLVVVSTSRPFGIEYVQPDAVYRIRNGKIENVKVDRQDLLADIAWRKGTKQDWEYFAQWHYRSGSPGIFNRALVFTYREHDVGMVIGGQPYLNISVRNRIFPHYKNNGVLVNKEIYQIHRIVISPEFRGLGLSKYMMDVVQRECYPAKTLVELVTSLNDYIPFATKSNFVFGGDLPDNPIRAFLKKVGFDLSRYLDDEYVDQFIRNNEPKVKQAIISSYSRGLKLKAAATRLRTNDMTFAQMKRDVQRMANVVTKYYYKVMQ
jgi:ABC-type ATPase with predicted acetyltransferase domain